MLQNISLRNGPHRVKGEMKTDPIFHARKEVDTRAGRDAVAKWRLSYMKNTKSGRLPSSRFHLDHGTTWGHFGTEWNMVEQGHHSYKFGGTEVLGTGNFSRVVLGESLVPRRCSILFYFVPVFQAHISPGWHNSIWDKDARHAWMRRKFFEAKLILVFSEIDLILLGGIIK